MRFLSPVDGISLRTGRVHEACGPAARSFAAALCGASKGPVLWITARSGEILCPQGLAGFFDPGRLIVVACAWPRDVLWTAEEALRSGAAPVVIAECAPDLTASRRLQLAAEAGDGIGLCLIGEDTVYNAAETRWRCTPQPGADDSTLQQWRLIKNKRGTLEAWTVGWTNGTAHSLRVVSPACERTRSADAVGR